jgi:hypothetical protein
LGCHAGHHTDNGRRPSIQQEASTVATISDYIHDGEFYDEVNDDETDLAFYRREC